MCFCILYLCMFVFFICVCLYFVFVYVCIFYLSGGNCLGKTKGQLLEAEFQKSRILEKLFFVSKTNHTFLELIVYI